jgi:hypothetical protein
MKIEMPDNVVSLEVFRADRQLKALKGQCPHKRLGIDPLDGLYCLDCDRQLNAVEWIIENIDQWRIIHQRMKTAQEIEAKAIGRNRVKCVHCKNMTPIIR